MAPAPSPELTELLEAPDPVSRERSWTRLLERHSGLLLHAAKRFGTGHDEAMDRYLYMLEELRRDDFRRLRAFSPTGPGKFSTWLLVVAYRLCGDFHRKRYGRERHPTTAGSRRGIARAARWRLQDFVVEELDPMLAGEPDADNPETHLRQGDLGRALDTALRTLAPQDRLLLHYRFEDDRSVAEITDLMSFPSVFHVHRRLRRLLGDLRRLLEGAGHDAPTP